MQSAAAFAKLVDELTGRYDPREAKNIAQLVFEDGLHLNTISRKGDHNSALTEDQLLRLEVLRERLLAGDPLQHVLEQAWFYERPFFVSGDVLIPRPETEELVYTVLNQFDRQSSLKVLDIGTGSGCIALTLQLERPNWCVEGVDVSEAALAVARRNAAALDGPVRFRKLDILNDLPATDYDLIISNPPYIPRRERAEMDRLVVKYEPDLALFVSDDDPLIFYRRLAEVYLAQDRPQGIYVESHHAFAKAVLDLWTMMGISNTEILTDLQGKERLVFSRTAR